MISNTDYYLFARNRKCGLSLVVVLVLSMSLLILASTYLSFNKQNQPINIKIFEFTQADFLAQGIVQLAALKFKKRPAEFYFAYRARKASLHPTLYNNYVVDDPTLNGVYTDQRGMKYRFRTSWELITNKAFEEDAIKIQVTVDQVDKDDNLVLRRVREHVIQTKRRPT